MSFRRLAVTSLVMLAIAASLAATTTFAAKPTQYAPTLGVTWQLGAAGTTSSSSTPYLVSGCGYDASLGGVTVVVYSQYAAAFAGQIPDSTGCISLSNFSTQGPGGYRFESWQHIGKKDVMVASTSFTS